MRLLGLIVILLFISGCASWGRKLKEFLGGEVPKRDVAQRSDNPRYSETKDLPPGVRRQYKRTTKESMADDAGLDQKSGSLWVMEGQGAYLFAQNPMRLVGDPIGVMIEGEPKEQLQAKVDVLRDLINKVEERNRLRQRQLAEAEAKEKGGDANAAATQPNAQNGQENKSKQAENEKKDEKQDFNVKLVPTKIVERTVEGNYRVKGSQPFMIGSREFKVIVTGVVRPEDFHDEGISASKLLDPKFDVVSAKRTGAEL